MNSTLTLLLGDAGTGKTERLLSEYRAALQRSRELRRPGRTLWIAPTHRARQSVLERLLSDDGVHLAPQVLTFDKFAERILAAAGWPATPMSSVMKRLLLRRIVADLTSCGKLSSFASVAHTGGFLDVVSQFISELKREEIWPETFLEACSHRPPNLAARDAELGQIYSRYQQQLSAQNWYDAEGRFWLARSALAEGVRGPFGTVELLVVDGFADFTKTQHEILGHLLGWIEQAFVSLPTEDPLSRPELFNKPEVTIERLRKHMSDETIVTTERLPSRRVAWPVGLRRVAESLFSNPRVVQPTNDATGLELIAATGPVSERQGVARRIKRLLETGILPKDIVIAMRSVSENGPEWKSYLSQAGIPVWCEAGSPLSASPVVKTLYALLQLELDDWSFSQLMRVLDSNYFQPRWAELKSGSAMRAVANTLRRLKLHAGRELILRVLRRVADSVTSKTDEPASGGSQSVDEMGDKLGANDAIAEDSLPNVAADALKLLERLVRATERLQRKHSLSDWANVVASLGDEFGWTRGAESGTRSSSSDDERDWDLLQRTIRTAAEADTLIASSPDSRSVKEPRLDLSEFAAELRDLLGGEKIKASADPGGCVRVLDVEQVRHLDVANLFVVGLSESSFPQNRSDDCLFGESERREFAQRGLALLHREQHQQDEMFLFYSVLTRARKQLTLSYPAVNSTGQPVFASPYVTALRSLFDGSALTIVHEGQLDPVPSVDDALTESDLRLAAMAEAREFRPGLFARLMSRSDGLAVGNNLLAVMDVNTHRFHTRGFTPYEGRLETPQNLVSLQQRFGSRHQFSATELEAYATCPFRFWLQSVLQVEDLTTPEEGTDYAARGRLIHDVLAQLLNEGFDQSAEQLAVRFQELVQEHLDRRFHETELQRALTRIEVRLLSQWGEAFARQQVGYFERLREVWNGTIQSLSPEVPFGRLPDAPENPGEVSNDPLVFGDGADRVNVRGRIDRVDVGVAAGQRVFNVIDYKTGNAPKSSEAELSTGRAMQLALYALAVKRLGLAGTEAIPFQMGYWSLKASGFKRGYQRETKSFDGLDAAAIDSLEQILEQVIPRLAQGIRAGKFLVENADTNCTGQCPGHTTCRVNQLRPLAEPLNKIGDILSRVPTGG